ncbi:MAG: hypothetical protein ACE37N_08475 [Pseudohongiellaceae bacterium]
MPTSTIYVVISLCFVMLMVHFLYSKAAVRVLSYLNRSSLVAELVSMALAAG